MRYRVACRVASQLFDVSNVFSFFPEQETDRLRTSVD